MNRLPLLTDSEVSTLTNGLLTAADKFDENAKLFRDMTQDLSLSPAARARLAEQFERQASDSRILAARIDDESEDA